MNFAYLCFWKWWHYYLGNESLLLNSCHLSNNEQKTTFKNCTNGHLIFCAHLKLRPFTALSPRFFVADTCYEQKETSCHCVSNDHFSCCVLYSYSCGQHTHTWLKQQNPSTVILLQATRLQKSQIYCVLKHGFNFVLSFCWSFALDSVLDLVNHFMMARNGLF